MQQLTFKLTQQNQITILNW